MFGFTTLRENTDEESEIVSHSGWYDISADRRDEDTLALWSRISIEEGLRATGGRLFVLEVAVVILARAGAGRSADDYTV